MNNVTLFPGTPIKIAILAMGGQGGGVLADWIVEMGEHHGWWAQTTSVPGVAQRTGATIYYLELLPEADAQAAGKPPVLAMSPAQGDVDVVIAAELMEAGRAMQRGLVTPDRTTLITSSHRSLAVAEKAAMGDGMADSNKVLEAGVIAAKRFMCFDLQAIADQAGSVISAALFGSLAGSGALPFGREAFEETIRRSGIGVEASLRAFSLGFKAAEEAPKTPQAILRQKTLPELPEKAKSPVVQGLLGRLRKDFPLETQPILWAGVCRLLDYQDSAYAEDYLQEMSSLKELDARYGGQKQSWALTVAAARYLAVAMSYDDVIRVADLKTRGTRFQRVAKEVGVGSDQLLQTTEFTHPGLAEICGTLPAGIGRRLERSAWFGRWVEKHYAKGKRIASSTLVGFLQLYLVAGMRRFRRVTLRHQVEVAQMRTWMDQVKAAAVNDYDLAVEIVNCRRLLKGYSGTLERGENSFSTVLMAAEKLLGKPGGALQLKRLREAALADERGVKLRDEWMKCFGAPLQGNLATTACSFAGMTAAATS